MKFSNTMNKSIFALMLAALVSGACSELELPTPDGDIAQPDSELNEAGEWKAVDTRNAAPGNVPGVMPVSGAPLTAVLNNGLAPLTFPKAIQSTVVGYVKTTAAYPDLLVQCSSGEAEYPMYYVSYLKTDGEGRLIYDVPVGIQNIPWNKADLNVRVVTLGDKVYGVHMTKTQITFAEFNPTSKTFSSDKRVVTVSGITNDVVGFEFVAESASQVSVMVICDDGSVYYPTLADRTDSKYDSAGIWMGELSNSKLFTFTLNLSDWSATSAALVSGTSRPMLNGACVASYSDAANNNEGYLVAGRLGAVSYVKTGHETETAYPLFDDGKEFSNRTYLNSIVSFAGAEGKTEVIMSGEGALYHCTSAQRYTNDGAPVFTQIKPIMVENGELFCGTMSVPNVADWDGDGILDIVSGNSDGRIAFFRNEGTNERPAFGEATYLKANGIEVRIRSGYYEIGGPFDSAWGYSCPVVCDWNFDGVPDVLVSSNASKMELYLGNGQSGADCLRTGRVVTCDGLEVWGMWQTRPAVMTKDNTLYVAFTDEEDAIHLYRKRSYGTVADCGLLHLKDGSKITCHRKTSLMETLTEQGKIKLDFSDWDGDGDHDLIVGTTSVSALPTTAGYPFAYGKESMQMLIFENISDDDEMVFDYPRRFKAFGGDFYMGSHAVAPTYCELGDSKRGPNMLVGCESGKFYFFARHDLREETL